MKLLVVFLLAALGCVLAEGMNVTKCGLRDELTRAIGELPEKIKAKGMTVDNILAQIVCHVEFASGFNTGAVNQLVTARNGRRRRREASGGMFGMAQFEGSSVTDAPHVTQRRHARQASDPKKNWTLYGIFQLSNHLVCKDGKIETENICMMDCKDLIDDNIQDDIGCLLKMFVEFVEHGFSLPYIEKLRMMILEIYQPECRAIKGSSYFAEC